MESLHHNPTPGNPCPESCQICDECHAAELATHLGLVDPDPAAIEADARAAESIRWQQWNPLFRRPTDEDYPGELARAWGPDPEDAAWAAQWNEEGASPDDLSPEEEALEILSEPAWERACREHARQMEEMEEEHLYHEMIGRLMMGGYPAEW